MTVHSLLLEIQTMNYAYNLPNGIFITLQLDNESKTEPEYLIAFSWNAMQHVAYDYLCH